MTSVEGPPCLRVRRGCRALWRTGLWSPPVGCGRGCCDVGGCYEYCYAYGVPGAKCETYNVFEGET